ncbi:MAG: DUF4368 domain-containing protein [Oscillospiraceae bacterium]|nr:DUF4368 domain-containing protein [Oscillospiraceae bacterium]
MEGKLSDGRFATMLAGFEAEQGGLRAKAAGLETAIGQANEQTDGAEKFIKLIRSYKNIEELTAEIAREFIEKIIVGEPVYIRGNREKRQSVEFVYNYVGRLPASIEQNE